MARVHCISLTVALMGVCALLGDQERFARHAPGLLAQLKRDSGLEDWHELAAEGVPEQERLMLAFERTAAGHRRDHRAALSWKG